VSHVRMLCGCFFFMRYQFHFGSSLPSLLMNNMHTLPM
jgi:hypothetical protein